jgi:cation diffusion facilitator CzcD-associated flavoprotein CzcO/predicted ATP-grasp superfamily ATP-dependent carboligase
VCSGTLPTTAAALSLSAGGSRSVAKLTLEKRDHAHKLACVGRRELEAGGIEALFLDAAQRQALVGVRELGRAHLRVGAAECHPGAPAFASRWCAFGEVLPDVAERRDAFVDALLEVCARHGPQALIPSHDGTIEALRERRGEVERVVGLALAREESLAIAVDKARTLALATEIGVRIPRGAIVRAAGDAAAALEEVGLPAVIKPGRSWAQQNGSGQRLSAVPATTRGAALAAIAAVLADGVEAVVQQWLPGEREAVSFIYAQGRFWARFAQRTTRTAPPLGGSSVKRESIPLPDDITRDAERLVTELDLEGYSEVEFRRDTDGRAALMEANPRLSASVEVAVRAGVPFPRLLYDWTSGGRLHGQDGYRTGVQMRWLGGDLSWLKNVLTDRDNPDVPARGRAFGIFLGDFLRPMSYDYLDLRDLRPALVASAETMSSVSQRVTRGGGVAADRHSGLDTHVAVIGAGPYGLSISAQLTGRGVRHMIFGEPMNTWCTHMPRGMCLKSEGLASNLSDPRGELTLERFCAEHSLEYGDVGVPVRLDTFERYGLTFQERYVPELRRETIERVSATATGFELGTSAGETLTARRVILATGVQGYAHLASALQGLPADAVVHSYDQHDPSLWRSRRVAVVGAGQSALDGAVLLSEAGAEVTVVARTPRLVWNTDPVLGHRSLWRRIRYPSSGLGDGLRMRLYASHPLVVHAAPSSQRLKVAYTALGPAGAWWLRPRFEGRVQALLGCAVTSAEMDGEEVRLCLRGPAGEEELAVSHVLAGTGYRVDLSRLTLLEPALRERIATAAGTPVLDSAFQSSVPGLHIVGYAAAGSFGPVMRFVFGADFTARRLARRFA